MNLFLLASPLYSFHSLALGTHEYIYDFQKTFG